MVARDEVLDHSEVMTALKGYSAPIPMPITNRHCAIWLVSIGLVGGGRAKKDDLELTHEKRARNDMSL